METPPESADENDPQPENLPPAASVAIPVADPPLVSDETPTDDEPPPADPWPDPFDAGDSAPLGASASAAWDPVAATEDGGVKADSNEGSGRLAPRPGAGEEGSYSHDDENWKSARSSRSRPSVHSEVDSGGSAMSSRLKRNCGIGFGVAVLLTAIGLLAASLKKVPSTQLGLEYDIHRKELDDAAKSGGLFVGPPGFRFIQFPKTFITIELLDRTCVSNDGLRVDFSVTFQYRMTEANLLPAIERYRDYPKWAGIVERAGLSAVHHSCAEFEISDFQNKRGVIQSTMMENLKLKLEGNEAEGTEGVRAEAVSLQLADVGLPGDYKLAVAEKQRAEEDIELATKERTQEVTKAETEYRAAVEEANRIGDAAANDAEVTLTEARLAAEETLYRFEKEAEALVEVKRQLNLTTEGVLAYLSNKLLAEANGTVRVTTGEPARLSRRDEL